MAAGSKFTLLLTRDASQSLPCTVAHCRQIDVDIFQIGAKFLDELIPSSKTESGPTSAGKSAEKPPAKARA
jgi:hypothetical protein